MICVAEFLTRAQTLGGTIIITFVLFTMTTVAANPSSEQGSENDTPLNVVEFPVSLERIKRQLARLPVITSGRNTLRLRSFITVSAPAPRINVFEGYDLHNGPVPYGTPTHAAMRAVTTPIEFRRSVATIGNLLGRRRMR